MPGGGRRLDAFWGYYQRTVDDKGAVKATCRGCGVEVSAVVSRLWRHAEGCAGLLAVGLMEAVTVTTDTDSSSSSTASLAPPSGGPVPCLEECFFVIRHRSVADPSIPAGGGPGTGEHPGEEAPAAEPTATAALSHCDRQPQEERARHPRHQGHRGMQVEPDFCFISRTSIPFFQTTIQKCGEHEFCEAR